MLPRRLVFCFLGVRPSRGSGNASSLWKLHVRRTFTTPLFRADLSEEDSVVVGKIYKKAGASASLYFPAIRQHQVHACRYSGCIPCIFEQPAEIIDIIRVYPRTVGEIHCLSNLFQSTDGRPG